MKLSIPTRRGSCTSCESSFLPGSICYSALTKENGEYVRTDFCKPCWKNENNQIFWKTVIPEKPQNVINEAKKTRDEKVLDLFKTTFQKDDFSKLFVLALYLARRRVLISRQELKEETLYELWTTGEMFTVPHVPLSSIQITHLQQAIATDLNETIP